MTNFKVGDRVYYQDTWVGWETAIITGFDDEGEIADLKPEYGTTRRYIKNLYKRKEDVINAIEEEDELIKIKYREQITDTKLLLDFMLNIDLSTCEYGDTNAREVAIEKAMELLGIELEFLGEHMESNRTLEQDFMLVVLGFIEEDARLNGQKKRSFQQSRRLADRILAETQEPRTYEREDDGYVY